MTVGSFLCLCPPKAIELGGSGRASRPDHRDRIRSALEGLDFGGRTKTVICMPGGGLAVEGAGCCPEVAVVGPLMAVLSGTIQNYAYLVRKYFVEEVGMGRGVSLEDLRQTTPIRDAALLCRLYQRLGTDMLAKLRGRFAFCLYDSSTVRVLAARDASGAVGLVQGTTSSGDLFVASGEILPPLTAKVAEIQPGMYKYGWRAPPRKYADRHELIESKAAAASHAASAALSGIFVRDCGASEALDSENMGRILTQSSSAGSAIPKFRTKAEVREWAADVTQEAIEAYEAMGAALCPLHIAGGAGGRRGGGEGVWAGTWCLGGKDMGQREGSTSGLDSGVTAGSSEESCGTGVDGVR
ncbi:unnamed protein product [Ostreobium quekettii]|uniref:Glutamine amidotransferase type-2 domain-containing protein n=1 Tax=Ostreobium quekettii TaxID=121088 RepID=A0A8S1J9J2_9CHLO|nr:unnamed protein product [Ostreobium quekettii]